MLAAVVGKKQLQGSSQPSLSLTSRVLIGRSQTPKTKTKPVLPRHQPDSVGIKVCGANSGDDLKDVREMLKQEISRAKKASQPQHFEKDIEGKAAQVSREARRLNELEADIAKLQAHLIHKRRDFQVEIQELDLLRAQLAKNLRCAGDQENGFLMQELEKREFANYSGTGGGERAAESGNTWPGSAREKWH